MTTTRLNPFPDYTVVRLSDDPTKVAGPTVVTPPIEEARRRVERYVETLGNPTAVTQTKSLLTAVRGDYGTGKTHLLLAAAAHLQSLATPTVVRVTCIETDALTWFCTKVGPELDRPFLTDIVTALYARAGETVAACTPLTRPAVEALHKDPGQIRELVRRDHLSFTAVEREFHAMLRTVCPTATEPIRMALAGLVWSETEGAARQWLSGQRLPPRDQELLHVPEALANADEAAALVGSLAAIHTTVRRPLLVLIDELEHFTRYDRSRAAGGGNITWLKRLLESLGSSATLVFVAGHWSAWETTTHDYLDRFPQLSPIDLLKLTAKDVVRIVSARVQPVPAWFGDAEAQSIIDATGGNMRRVLSLCHALFREFDGFSRPCTSADISATATQLAQRVPPEEAIARVQESLEARGFKIEVATQVEGVPFDLIAYRDDKPVIAVKSTHAAHQLELYESARRFMDQLADFARRAPGVVGLFLAAGNVDDELLSILRSAPESRVHWFDLTERDVLTRVAAALQTVVPEAKTSAGAKVDELERTSEDLRSELAAALETQDTRLVDRLRQQQEAVQQQLQAVTKQIAVQNSELERQLASLENRRSAEMAELYQRLDRLASNVGSPREAEILGRGDASFVRLRAMYDELIQPPSLVEKLVGMRRKLLSALSTGVLGALLILMTRFIPEIFARSRVAYTTSTLVLMVAGLGLVLFGVWMVWRGLVGIEAYFSFRRRVLRDLYVRDGSPSDLATADGVLRDVLRSVPPPFTRDAAVQALAHQQWQSTTVEQYIHELKERPFGFPP